MACEIMYRPQPSPEDLLNQARNEAFDQIEQQLGQGSALIETNPITGEVRLVGATVWPEGMSDLCVLDALQQRNSLEWQLAAAAAGVQNQNFQQAHAHAHAHGHQH